jgi:hypothetical protein
MLAEEDHEVPEQCYLKRSQGYVTVVANAYKGQKVVALRWVVVRCMVASRSTSRCGLTLHALKIWSEHPSIDMMNCPSTAARCRAVSYLVNMALTDSFGRRANARSSVMLVSRVSSASGAKRVCNAVNEYVTGSSATPFRTPPNMISWVVMVRANSLADPPSLMMIAAHC